MFHLLPQIETALYEFNYTFAIFFRGLCFTRLLHRCTSPKRPPFPSLSHRLSHLQLRSVVSLQGSNFCTATSHKISATHCIPELTATPVSR
jgi:hypothetical protein